MTWSAVAYVAYNSSIQCVFAIDGALRKRYEGEYGYEWGSEAPYIPPSIAAGTTTGLTGDYNAKYTYARKERDVLVYETNPSPAADDAVTLTNDSIEILVTAPTDSQINCIRIYRTTAGGATYYYDKDINYVNRDYAVTYDWEEAEYDIGTPAYNFTLENIPFGSFDTYSWEQFALQFEMDDVQIRITSAADNIYYLGNTYTAIPGVDDTTVDALLSVSVESDHDRPPAGGPVFGPTNNGVLFICYGHRLYFCKPQQPEYWPANYYVDVSIPQSPLVGGCFWNQHPYVFDNKTGYLIDGSGSLVPIWQGDTLSAYRLDYTPYNLSTQTGAQSNAGILAVEGEGIFHTGIDGIYLLSPGSDAMLSKDQNITFPVSRLFTDIVNGMQAVGDMAAAWLLWYNSSLYFGYAGLGETYPSNVLVLDTDTKRWGYYKYPVQFIHAITDKYNNRILAVTTDGQVWELENSDYTKDQDDYISWEVETKEFILQTRRHFPRWTKYDVDASEADSATGYNILSGDVVQTHTITGDRDTKRRLVALSNGNRFSVRISGEGTAKIYAVESE